MLTRGDETPCPKCRWPLKPLAQHVYDREEGVLTEYGDEAGGYGFGGGVYGVALALLRQLYHYTLQPLWHAVWGKRKLERRRQALAEHPNSLYCPRCELIVRRP